MADRRDRAGQHRRGHRGQPRRRRQRGGRLRRRRGGRWRPSTGATAAPDVAAVAGQADITLLSLPTPDVVDGGGRGVGVRRPRRVPILVDLSTNSPAVVRELGERLAASGHHLVEAPLTGGRSAPRSGCSCSWSGGDDEPVARVLPVLEPLGRATFHVGRARSRQHHEAAQQPDRLHDDLGQPGGIGDGHQGGHRGAEGGGDPAHGGRVQLLHRPPGRDHRRPRPAHAVRAGAGGQGRRSHRGDRATRSDAPTPVAAAIKGCSTRAVAQGFGGADWSELVTFAERQADVALRWNAG